MLEVGGSPVGSNQAVAEYDACADLFTEVGLFLQSSGRRCPQ